MGVKKHFLITLCVASTFVFAIPAYADSSKEINSVYIRLEEEKVEPGQVPNVALSTSSSNYQIVSAEPSKEYGDWEPGRKITFEVIIEPFDGYYFNKKHIDDISVSNGVVSYKKVTSDEIEAKISYVPKVTLASPQNLYFENEYEAKWDEVEYCNAYEVDIYEEDEETGDWVSTGIVKVTTESIDLSSYVTDHMGVTFKVRAIPKNSEEDKYMEPSEWVSIDEIAYSSENTSYGEFSGESPNLKFIGEDGEAATGWQQINGNWYYFDSAEENYAACDEWKYINSNWYRFGADSIMKTGWVKVNGKSYYLNTDTTGNTGAMVTGWISTGPNGPWYYLDDTGQHSVPYGVLWVNTTTPDGYTVDSTGAYYGSDLNDTNSGLSGVNQTDYGITYKHDDGTYASGWTQLDNNWYYFDSNNYNRAITSNWYFDGVNWFRFNEQGQMLIGWQYIDGYWYYMNLKSDGTRGAMKTGWLQETPNSLWYYLQAEMENKQVPLGAMYADRITPDGFYVNSSGAWIR